jgi:tRNA G18 (ribose-2'-O)-methylase SpoU
MSDPEHVRSAGGPPRIRVTSVDDPRIALYRNLKKTNATRWSGLFVVEGEKLVERLVASPYPVESVLATERLAERIGAALPDGIPLYVVPDPLADLLVGFNFHQGVLACGRRLPAPDSDIILSRAGEEWTVVACPDVQDPENLGNILRISAAFGVAAVLLGPRAADHLSRRVLRVSMGAALRLPIIPRADLEDWLRGLKDRWSARLVATVLDPRAEPLAAIERSRRTVLLLGSEGHGLTPEYLALADRQVTIPMHLGTDSLNVAVAAGIFLYHFQPPRG